MVSFLENFPPIIQALWGTGFTYLMTALGALGVFLGRELDKRLLNGMMGFAAGVMIAASYFSLLAPSIELSADLPGPIWLPAVGGFLLGGGFLWGVDKILPHLHVGDDQPEGLRTTWQRNILLVFAITLHNIPEGMAMAAPLLAGGVGRTSAVLLTIAAGLPMGLGALAGGLFGQLTPPTLAGTLGFAAGAMLFLVFHELLPEANCLDFPLAATLGAIFGVMLGLGLLVIH